MRFSPLNSLRTVLLILLPMLSGCHSLPQAFVREVESYRGDGLIEETTVHTMFSAIPGYRITLPAIDPVLGKETVFHLGRLPSTKFKAVGFLLLFEPALDLHEYATRLALSIEVRDETGTIVYRHSGISERYVEKFIFLRTERGYPWSFGAPYLPINKQKKYTLNIRYATMDLAINPQLTLVVWSGGVY